MTPYKYQYIFPLTTPNGVRLERSAETSDHLPSRAATEDDRDLIVDFIASNKVGSFIVLSTGEYIFQTA